MIGTELASEVLSIAAPSKVQPHHQDRLAVVYVRQSTAQQVLEHRESAALQYNLRRRAVAWGWPDERVLVIDDDQGHTASTIEGRVGFQRLLAEVTLNHVGLVLGLELSRLARSYKDWHQLLEVCALFGTLLADQDGLYDPRQYNDRLLLGLKGAMSEAELHILKQRMHQGRLNKAKRGELFNHAPIGYVRSPGSTGELALDPDEQVQAVVHLIFDQFDELGTINAVLKYLVRHDIHMPIRPHMGSNRGQLQWRRPNRQTLRNVLHHPLYAGAYTCGRRPADPRCKIPGRPCTGRKVATAEQCQVLIKDHCPAYITWRQYQAHQQQLAENQARSDKRGAPREGSALLQGVAVCGRCGCRMTIQYDQVNRPRYACTRRAVEYGEKLCQSLAGTVVDQLIEQQVLAVLKPASIELCITAVEDIEQQRAVLNKHWLQRLERANYDADRAQRQYQAVEPENRLVGRELERQWEQQLLDQRHLREQYDRFQQEQTPALTDQDRHLIQALSNDIPRLWQDERTPSVDRRTIVRHLIQQVVVTVPDQSQRAELTIHWAGGFVSQHALVRPVANYDQLDYYPQLLQRILELHDQKQTAGQIANTLNVEGLRPPKRCATFNAGMIRQLLWRQRRATKRSTAMQSHPLADHEWWFSDLARHLQIPQPTLYSWMRRGWVHARQLPVNGGRWILWADTDELSRLQQLKQCPRSWHNQPQTPNLATPKPRPAT